MAPWFVTIGLFLGSVAATSISDEWKTALDNRYIVSLKSGLSPVDVEQHRRSVSVAHSKRNVGDSSEFVGIDKIYDVGTYHGYAGSFDAVTMAEIEADDNVYIVEPDTPVYPFDGLVTQTGAAWGLGAISHPEAIPLNQSLRDGYKYMYPSTGDGQGTYAYVIDTGVWVENPDFEGRAELGYSAFPDAPFEDDVGHGTHVAGTIASKTWGVAKKANVVAVKVMTAQQSSMSLFMDGFSWAVSNITNTPGRAAVSVVNMSLGGPQNWSFNNMVYAAFEQGVLSVVSAGNAAYDAGRVSPAGAPGAVTVAASAANNTAWEWSNYGLVVDLYAPGVDVYSLSLEEGQAVALTGTSMSAPHVAGLVLSLKSSEEGLDAADVVTARLLELCRPDVIEGVPSSTSNCFAYNGVGAAAAVED